MRRLLTAAFAAISMIFPTPEPTSPTHPPLTPRHQSVVLGSIGDSLAYGTDGSVTSSYRGELSRLLDRSGQPHTWRVDLQPGAKCSHWVNRIDGFITQHQPHMIFFSCGTNDVPGVDDTEEDVAAVIATARARNVQVVASLSGVPDMRSETNVIRPHIISWMYATYQALQRAVARFPGIAYADFSKVPANNEWLQPDGIHLKLRAERAYAWLFFVAARAWRGWDANVTEPCGLSGVWPHQSWRTDYRVCLN